MALIELDLNPSRRTLRWFAAIWWPAFFGLVGAIVLHVTGSLPSAAAVWGIALLVSVVGLLSPRFMGLVYVGWMCVVYPIGWLVSHLILAVVFFLVITPIGAVASLVRRDPLKLRFDASRSTYWTRYEPDDETSRYFEQF
jgi:hypothetical protein